jgi:hypothetical protein
VLALQLPAKLRGKGMSYDAEYLANSLTVGS